MKSDLKGYVSISPGFGLERWARKVLAEAPVGSNDADVARRILAELENAAQHARALHVSGLDIGEAVTGYLEAKLWTTRDELADGDPGDGFCPDGYLPQGYDRSKHGDRLEVHYGTDDIAAAFVAEVRAEIEAFAASHPLAVRMYVAKRSSEDFGHDFLLNRDGHGAGFWDRGLGQLGSYLADIARPYGSSGDLMDGILSSEPERRSGRLYSANG